MTMRTFLPLALSGLSARSSPRLLTSYVNSGGVLVLQRRGPGAAISASSACSKAYSAIERASCVSPALAGYDRRVAAA